MATPKEELPVLGMRQVVVTCRRGTSLARSLKLLALPHSRQQQSLSTNITVPTREVVIGELPCVTNTDQWLNTQSTTEQLGSQQKRQSRAGVPYALIWNGSRRYCATLDLRKTSNRSVTEYWEIPSCVHHAEQPRLRRFGRVL